MDDRHIIRRMILKRCIYGVDLNPMAVELAKLALWLHSFTVGAPLSFLDHHLRCGDSLFGEFVGPVERDLHARYGFPCRVPWWRAQRREGHGAGGGTHRRRYRRGGGQCNRLRGRGSGYGAAARVLDLYHAARWLPDMEPAAEAGRGILFGGGYGDPVALAAGRSDRRAGHAAADIRRRNNKTPIKAAEAHKEASRFVAAARTIARERRFFNWEVAFPGV